MMGGGVMMLGVGSLMMLLIIGLPVLLVVAVVGLIALLKRPAATVFSSPMQVAQMSAPAVMPTRYCSHCGQGLQAEWTHCPKCGAPIEAK